MHPVAVKEQTPHQVGFYQLGEEIGRGPVAVVYRATDTLYDREVALKVLHPYFAHYLAFVRHFIAEGREMARLHHPNIVPLLDAGQADGVSYIVQDLVIGGTLADMLRARNEPFTVDETLAVVEQVAAGLDYAHHQGLLHRNLKPSNIFVADQGRVQLADFSAAWPGSSPLSANFPVGDPAFMAPEQARGDGVLDQRADIYTLGVLAFRMLTGRLPFVADNPLVLLRKIVDEPPPQADQLNPALSPLLTQVLDQVLAKQPQARYVTASAFAQALGGAADRPMQRPSSTLAPVAFTTPPESPDTPLLIPQQPEKTLTEAKLRPDWRILTLLGILGTVLVALLLNAAFYYLNARLAPLERTELPRVQQAVGTQVATYTPTIPPPATPTGALASQQAKKQEVVQALPVVHILPTLPSAPATATPDLQSQVSDFTPLVTATAPLSTTAVALPIAAPVAPPAGRIAYTRWNPRTDRLDTIIYTLATGVHWPVIPDKRQPDFNNQSDLAVNGEGGNADNLMLMRNTEPLAIISAHAEDAHPHWSPTNKTVVFASTLVGDGRQRLYLQQDDAYGAGVSPMMYDAWELFGRYPIFLRDGRIAYNGCDVWENGSTCGVYVVDTNGGKPTGITSWPGDTPTDNLGSQVLFMADRDGDWNIYRVDPVSQAVQQLTHTPGIDGLATTSPDGNFIAFLTNRDGAWAIYTMRADGSEQRKLFDLDGGYGRDDRDWLQERISWGR